MLNDNFAGRRTDESKADQVAGCFADKFAGFFTDKLAGRRADKPDHIPVSLPPDLPTHTSYLGFFKDDSLFSETELLISTRRASKRALLS